MSRKTLGDCLGCAYKISYSLPRQYLGSGSEILYYEISYALPWWSEDKFSRTVCISTGNPRCVIVCEFADCDTAMEQLSNARGRALGFILNKYIKLNGLGYYTYILNSSKLY